MGRRSGALLLAHCLGRHGCTCQTSSKVHGGRTGTGAKLCGFPAAAKEYPHVQRRSCVCGVHRYAVALGSTELHRLQGKGGILGSPTWPWLLAHHAPTSVAAVAVQLGCGHVHRMHQVGQKVATGETCSWITTVHPSPAFPAPDTSSAGRSPCVGVFCISVSCPRMHRQIRKRKIRIRIIPRSST